MLLQSFNLIYITALLGSCQFKVCKKRHNSPVKLVTNTGIITNRKIVGQFF
jgi:hypothetical protein